MIETTDAPAGAATPHALTLARHLLLHAMLRPDSIDDGGGDEDASDSRQPARPARSRRPRDLLAASAALLARGTPDAAQMAPEAIADALATGDDPWASTTDMVPVREAPLPAVGRLLALASLAALLPAPEDLDALLAPGAVTLLAVPGDAARETVRAALAEAGDLLGLLPERDRARDGALVVRRVEAAGRDAGTRSDDARARAAVERDVAGGVPLIVVASGREALPEAARLVLGRQVAWPDPSADMVIEVLRATHSDTGAVAEDALRAILPAPDRLARLPQALWDRAWTERTTVRVARALAAACDRLPRASGITLADVHGQPAAVAALGAMAADLADWRAGRVAWRDVSSSALLYGPPGCGKTMAAAALAGSAKAHLVATSYADAQKAGHLGDCLRVMAERVGEAIARAPSVYYFDELDSFGSRDDGGGRYDRYMTSVINALLEHLSRLADSPGVLVLAGTNHRDRLDPAIVRAGRYDRHIEVGPPDRAGLAAILRAHLGERADGLDLAQTVDRLVGASGADVAAIARAALGLARRQGRGPATEDLERAVDQLRPAHAPDVLRAIAIHEAGHVVVTAEVGLPLPTSARITPDGGETRAAMPGRPVRGDLDARLAVLLAGRAAERLVLGDVGAGAGLGPGSDLDVATSLALAVECEHGLGDHGLAHAPIGRMDRHRMAAPLRRRVEVHLRTAEARAATILRARRGMLDAVADALLIERELGEVRIADLAGAGQGPSAVSERSADANTVPIDRIESDDRTDPAPG